MTHELFDSAEHLPKHALDALRGAPKLPLLFVHDGKLFLLSIIQNLAGWPWVLVELS